MHTCTAISLRSECSNWLTDHNYLCLQLAFVVFGWMWECFFLDSLVLLLLLCSFSWRLQKHYRLHHECALTLTRENEEHKMEKKRNVNVNKHKRKCSSGQCMNIESRSESFWLTATAKRLYNGTNWMGNSRKTHLFTVPSDWANRFIYRTVCVSCMCSNLFVSEMLTIRWSH